MARLTPEQVVPTLRKHMLVDGFDEVVLDLHESRGHYLYDALNKRHYLDLFGFFATTPVAHNHPKLLEPEFREKILNVAIMKPSNSDFYSREMADFVDYFSRHAIPDYLPYLFFVSGGALAVENALKAAFDWKVRKNFQKGYREEKGSQVIHFKEAFHGRSGYTLSLTNTADPRKYKYFPKFDWPRVTNPKMTFPLTKTNLERVAALERQAVAEIKEAIHNHPDDIAAIIIEPIQGEGGDNHFRKEFLWQLRHLADENDIMLIFDEIQTGVGLTGAMWCHQHFDVRPDMMAFGKKTQVCGFLCSKRIDEVEDNVFHESSRLNSTWGGNLVDMVRFQKYLEIIVTENLIDNVREVGAYFMQRLSAWQQEVPDLVTNLRGRGLMIAFDLPNTELRNNFLSIAFKHGFILLGCGVRSVRVRPALDLPEERVDEAMEILRHTATELTREGRPKDTPVKDQAQFEL